MRTLQVRQCEVDLCNKGPPVSLAHSSQHQLGAQPGSMLRRRFGAPYPAPFLARNSASMLLCILFLCCSCICLQAAWLKH